MLGRKRSRMALGAVCAGLVIGLSAVVTPVGGVGAAATGKVVTTGLPAAVSASRKVALPMKGKLHGPPGYVMVTSPFLTAPSGTQTNGTVACPAGTVPLSGGAQSTSGSLNTNLNSSYPISTGWSVDVNNEAGFDTIFAVYVICAAAPSKYKVILSPVTVSTPNNTDFAQAACPTGTVVYGGGMYSSSGLTSVNINGDNPQWAGTSYWWDAEVENLSTTSTTFEAYAICGHKLSKYTVVDGTQTDNPPLTQTTATAYCPVHTLILGGGMFSYGFDLLNSSFTYSNTGWTADMNNPWTTDSTFYAEAICAA